MSKRKAKKNNQAQANMFNIIIPQMGEGLQEVKIIRFLKQPGDWIKEDEVIYEMETDKSTVEVESSHAGTLVEWLVTEGSNAAVGAILGRLTSLETNKNLPEATVQPVIHQKEITKGEINLPMNSSAYDGQYRAIPPRTRAYCKAQGISIEEMLQIPAQKKLLPSDVDNYLKAKNQLANNSAANYRDITLSSHQQLLIQRFRRSQQQIVPATLVSILNVKQLNAAARHLVTVNVIDSKSILIFRHLADLQEPV